MEKRVIICSDCGKRLLIPKDYSRKYGKCPGCGKKISLVLESNVSKDELQQILNSIIKFEMNINDIIKNNFNLLLDKLNIINNSILEGIKLLQRQADLNNRVENSKTGNVEVSSDEDFVTLTVLENDDELTETYSIVELESEYSYTDLQEETESDELNIDELLKGDTITSDLDIDLGEDLNSSIIDNLSKELDDRLNI